MGDVLHQNGLAGPRRRHDQGALALAQRRHDIDDPARPVFLGRILDFHVEPLIGIERGQVIEVNLVAGFLRFLEIDRGDLQEREITLIVPRRPDLAFHGVAGAQAKATDLAGGDIDVVRARQIVGFRRAQEAETVLQHFQRAPAGNLRALIGQRLEDGEHHALLAQGGGVLDIEAFSQLHQLGGRLFLQFLKRHATGRSGFGFAAVLRLGFRGISHEFLRQLGSQDLIGSGPGEHQTTNCARPARIDYGIGC